MDNLTEALKQSEKEGGTAQVVKDENGKIIGYCGMCQPGDHPMAGLFKSMIKQQEVKND